MKFSLPTTPFVLCFLIGEMLETYLRRGIMQYKSFGAFFARPIFDAFFFVAIGVLVWTVMKELKAYKDQKTEHRPVQLHQQNRSKDPVKERREMAALAGPLWLKENQAQI